MRSAGVIYCLSLAARWGMVVRGYPVLPRMLPRTTHIEPQPKGGKPQVIPA
jgi:hypothetical protein